MVERLVTIGAIEDMRAMNDRCAELDGFDRILSAMSNQRSAHEYDRREPVEQPQFAHRIADIGIGGRYRQSLARTKRDMQARSRDQTANGSPASRVSRHDHRQQRRKI